MISIEEKKPYKQWLRSPYKSDGWHFEFQFEFTSDDNGNLRASNLKNGDVKTYPFHINAEDNITYITIECLPFNEGDIERKGIKKDLSATLHFLIHNVSDLENQFMESEASLKSTIEFLSNPIISKNRNIEFKYVFLDEKSGILKIIDNRVNKITEGTFSLLFSEDYNFWFIDMHANISIRTPVGVFPLLGCFAYNLYEHVNKMSN
jgi:hypothetical protein